MRVPIPEFRAIRALRMPTLLILAAGLVALLPAAASAQTGRVTGTVLNASNNSPIGVAQIRIGDTGLGGVTGDNGRFVVLEVPAGTHEVFVERIGFRTESQTAQVSVGQAAVLEFRLSETALELDEIVVTGTPGASSRRELGNSVGSVRAATLEYTPAQSLTEILNGQTTGLQQWRNEGQVGGGSKIVLRGINSISQDVQPLIYVDGDAHEQQLRGSTTTGPASTPVRRARRPRPIPSI